MSIYSPKRSSGKLVVQSRGLAQSDISRMLPRQVSTGALRGTQTVGYGGVKIDGSNNRIILNANDTTVTIGDTSDTDSTTGVSLKDSSGNTFVTLGKGTDGGTTTGLTIYDGDNTRRLLGGQFPDGQVKIKLSQIGYDVAFATDDQLIWSSDFNMFKIVDDGSIPLSFTATGANGELITAYAHGLDYIPKVEADASVDDNLSPGSGISPNVTLPYTAFNAGLTAVAHFQIAIDTTNLYFIANWTSALPAATYNNACYFTLLKETFTS